MEAGKPFVPRLEERAGGPDFEPAPVVVDEQTGAMLEHAAAAAGLQPEAPELTAPQGAPFSLRGTLKLFALLAIAGWFTFLYFSNDNIPVDRFYLSPLLPRRVEGWKSGLPEGSNPSSVSIGVGVTFEKFTSSSVWRTYYQGDKEITLEIWDWAGDYPYHMPIDIPGWANGEAVHVGAEEGRLRYNPETRKGRLRVRYLDRFYLIVEGKGIERYELESWYRRIDLAGLRRELDKLHRRTSSR
jgi:hypothetical protein